MKKKEERFITNSLQNRLKKLEILKNEAKTKKERVVLSICIREVYGLWMVSKTYDETVNRKDEGGISNEENY